MFRNLFRRRRRLVELPGYVALGRIREGSMATLFRAKNRETGQIVAIKVIKPEARHIIEKIDTRYRQFSECDVLRALDHPNIVKEIETGRLGVVPYLVMEYVDGITLASLLDNESNRLDGKRVDILRQAASALQHIHSRGFIHHDFCPKNLILTTDDVVKVVDFGLAMFIGPRPKLRRRLGTAEFMAPELLRHEPCDERIDIFAFGVTAYEVFTGRYPFETAEHMPPPTRILNMHPHPPRHYNPEVPEELSSLVMQCTKKDPQQRVSNMNL
ncbi:MAG: serine/threonine-protein kinase, partial [Planctomycetia bacterium]|nr:serine/threonine-protein kinase [Planctomycetia bacterium]